MGRNKFSSSLLLSPPFYFPIFSSLRFLPSLYILRRRRRRPRLTVSLSPPSAPAEDDLLSLARDLARRMSESGNVLPAWMTLISSTASVSCV